MLDADFGHSPHWSGDLHLESAGECGYRSESDQDHSDHDSRIAADDGVL